MQVNFTLKINHMLKKSIISFAMIGAVALVLASSGGGEKKKTSASSGLSILKSTPGFSLRAGRSYTNSLTFKSRPNSFALNNTVITYRKGNTIYILPSPVKYKKPLAVKNNLNIVNFKVKLSK